MFHQDLYPKPQVGSSLKASLVPLSHDGPLGDTTDTLRSHGEQHLLPLLSQALAPLLEQAQANSNAIARIEQSIASLTSEQTNGMETIPLLTSCLEKAVDDVRLQADVLRTTQQEMACNAAPVEHTAETGRTAESAAAAVTFDEMGQTSLKKSPHSPIQQQQQQRQQPPQQPQRKHGMMTDDDWWQPEPLQTNISEGSITAKGGTHRLQTSKFGKSATRFSEDSPMGRRLSISHRHLTKPVNASVRNFRMDVALLEDEASISMARAAFKRLGVALDWWISMEEPVRSGPFFAFVHSRKFDMIVACLIIANSVTMTLAADHNIAMTFAADQDMTTRAHSPFVYAEWCFVCLYLLELVAKLSVHGVWFFFNEDALWNIVDCILVVSSLYDAIVQFLAIGDKLGLLNLRILRLIRVFRVLRLLRLFSEAWLLVKTVISSFLHLFWGMLLLAFMFYVFAMLIVQDIIASREHTESDLDRDISDNFGSVQKSMMSLFKAVSTGEVWNTYLQVLPPLSACMLVFFVCLFQLQIANILTAIVVQHTQRIFTPDALTQASIDQAKLLKESEELRQLIKQADHGKSGSINARELRDTVEFDDDMKIQLRSLGLDVEDLQKFFDLLVEHLPDGNKRSDVEIERFVEAFMRMKGAAKIVTQETLLMETRALSQMQARNNLYMKNWQREVNQKLDMLFLRH